MKKILFRHLSILASICLMINAVIVFAGGFVTKAVAVPAGYTQTPAGVIALKTDEYYKEISGFEGEGIRASDIKTDGNLQLNYSAEHVVNGTQNAMWTFSSGSNNDIKITCFLKTDNTNYKDWSKAKYVQFYVDNPNATKIQFGNITLVSGGVSVPIANGVDTEFYNTVTNTWSTVATKDMANTAYKGVEVQKETKGFVRIPVNNTVFPGLTDSQRTNIDRIVIFVQMPGCAAGSKVYADDYGLVGDYESFSSDIYQSSAPKAQLLAGQTYKLLTGFDGSTGINPPLNGGANDQRGYSDTNYLTAAPSAALTFTNGGVGGHQSMTIPLADKAKLWSRAKYLQFYVENSDANELELFFFKVISDDNTQMEIKANAAGMAFYNAETTVWSEQKVTAAASYGVQAIKIPGKTKGILRIPLSADVFSNFDAAKLDSMNKIDLYAFIPGTASGSKAYFDDFALIGGALNAFPGGTPLNYSLTAPYAGIPLLSGQFYQQLTGFEDKGIRAADIAVAGSLQLNYSAANVVNGTKNLGWTFQDGSNNAIKITNMVFDNSYSTDWSNAKYLQFYVDNPMTTPLHLGLLQLYNGNTKIKIAENVSANLYLPAGDTWTTLKTKKMANPAYVGLEIPANTKGYVRIALNETTYPGLTAVAKANISSVEILAQMPGCISPSNAYLDDLALIAGADNVFPVVDNYDETTDVKLNPGEKFRYITSFEDSDSTPTELNKQTGLNNNLWSVSSDVSNNGDKSLKMTLTDGSAGGHKNFSLDTSGGLTTVWTKAKYLQFYIKNTCPSNANPLQLFYIQVNSGNKMLSRDATGLKLYNLATKKWSDLAVVDNTDHFYKKEGDTKFFVPTIQIPAGFEGYVRIPLTNENFMNCTLSEELPKIGRLAMYGLIKGVPGAQSIYIDDIGLVTYDGATAPAYVNDAVDEQEPGGGLEDGQDDQYIGIEKTFAMSGKVTDNAGNPVAGAVVSLDSVMTIKTNSKGEYRFDRVLTGLHEITMVDHDGTDYGFVSFEVLTGATTRNSGTDIRIGHTADGITVNFLINEFSEGSYDIQVSGVAEGAFVPVSDGDSQGSNPDTGDQVKIIAVLMFVVGVFGILLSVRRTKIN